DVDGQVMTVLGIAHDITELKQAERERQHHTEFLANMDRINRAIQKANDLEQMMRDVLGEVLAVFDCDRVSLVYPCDPDAASWTVPMERFKPEYPGVLSQGVAMPMTPEVAAMHRASLESKQPLAIGVGTDFPYPSSFQAYGDKSGIGMALFPKTGKPWGLAISQCSRERQWTPTELRLFEEIARRLADALSTLLVFRDLQDAQAVVENSSAVLLRIKALEGWVVDYVSENVQKLIGYTSEELTSGRIRPDTLIYQDDLEKVVRRMAEHKEANADNFILEYRMVTKDGRVFWVEDRTTAVKDATGKVAHYESVIVDQTERRQALEQLRESLVGTIRAISLVVEKRDPYTAGHQNKVAKLSAAIGTELGLNEDHIEGLGFGGMIHDIGKIYVPAEILSRPGRLNDIEYAMIKSHPQVGYEIVKDIAFPWPVAKMILQHHERMDGSGYPNGLKANEMILEAKIIAVADVVEAMLSHRPYRPSKGVEQALQEIETNRGSKYDPDVVDACLRLFRERGFVLE
ncbi:MAG: HD domain-containing protein, partial [Gammaproteobacteria bacterium]|nr:HD domain-containing protein [Gammaproteobacteria bacterium]